MSFTDACEPKVEQELFDSLSRMPELRRLGLNVKMGEPCGVAISYGNHVRAIWHAGSGEFDFIPAGYSLPQIIVRSLDEVYQLTLDYLGAPRPPSQTISGCACGCEAKVA